MAEVTLTASGPVESGKSAILASIASILTNLLGVPVRHDRSAIDADGMDAVSVRRYLEMYRPTVVLVERIEHSAWQPIDTAPRSGFGKPRRYVLVRGPSGTVGTDHDVILAYHDAEYRPHDPWRDVNNDALSDFGFEPTEWMEVPT